MTERDPPQSPTPDALPGEAASLEEIGRFIRAFDPTRHFVQRWGEGYRAKAQSLWQRCVADYKAGRTPTGPADELLLCLAYDWALGPHLGVPEPEKLSFLRWLVGGISRQLPG